MDVNPNRRDLAPEVFFPQFLTQMDAMLEEN